MAYRQGGIPSHGPGCRTQTHPIDCPDCGADIYFFSCNHGTKMFFDALGYPWPEHVCANRWIAVGESSRRQTSYSPEHLHIHLSCEDHGIIEHVTLKLVNALDTYNVPYKGPRIPRNYERNDGDQKVARIFKRLLIVTVREIDYSVNLALTSVYLPLTVSVIMKFQSTRN